MKKIFLPLFMIVISFSFVNAEDLNNSKSMTNEEFLKKMQQLENEKENSKEKTKLLENELKKTEKEVSNVKELRKTVDEIKDKLAIDKK